MSSELETQTPLSSMNNIPGIMNETLLFSINFQLQDTDSNCHYRHNGDLNPFSNGLDTQEYSKMIKDNNLSLQSRSVMKIPVNLMPPPPLKMNKVNSSNNKGDRRDKQRGHLRSISPKGYESDESCTSFPSRITPPDNGPKYKNNRNGMGRLGDQTVMFGKFSHSSPNMFLYNHNNGNYHRNNSNNGSSRGSKQQQQQQPMRSSSDVMVRRAHGLMERFKSRAYLMRVDPNPPELLTGGPFDQLNQAIWDVFSSKAQQEDTYLKKLNLWRSVFLYFREFLDNYGLFLVGSTMSSFGLENSDIDICLLIKPFMNDPRLDSVRYLEHLKACLLRSNVASEAEVIHAKVPILKFRDSETGFEVDLNCNNAVGIRNTHLLHCYARLDWRVRPLVVAVKLWAQANRINDAKNMTVSSYSWTLMVVHYLQCGVTPPILPCLHGLVPEKFNTTTEHQSMDVQEELDGLRDYHSDNPCTLGELLLGFLHYYSCFDYDRYAISVRAGTRLSVDDCRNLRAPKNDPNQWKLLCIEEPFDFTNTARSVYDPDTFSRVKDILRRSYGELAAGRCLSSILPVTPR